MTILELRVPGPTADQTAAAHLWAGRVAVAIQRGLVDSLFAFGHGDGEAARHAWEHIAGCPKPPAGFDVYVAVTELGPDEDVGSGRTDRVTGWAAYLLVHRETGLTALRTVVGDERGTPIVTGQGRDQDFPQVVRDATEWVRWELCDRASDDLQYVFTWDVATISEDRAVPVLPTFGFKFTR